MWVDQNNWGKVLLVCNYGGRDDGGNTISRPVYISGQPCTSCSGGLKCSRKWQGLCGDDVRIGTRKQGQERSNNILNTLPQREQPLNTLNSFISQNQGNIYK